MKNPLIPSFKQYFHPLIPFLTYPIWMFLRKRILNMIHIVLLESIISLQTITIFF